MEVDELKQRIVKVLKMVNEEEETLKDTISKDIIGVLEQDLE